MAGANVGRGPMRDESDVPELQDLNEKFALKVELESMRVEELDRNLVSTRAAIEENLVEREKRGGINAARNSIASVAKKIRLQEEKLHRLCLREGDVLTDIGNLKHEINELRKQHIMRKEVYETLRLQLETITGRMAGALERCDSLVEEKDKAAVDLTRMHELVEEEENKHRKTMKALNRKVVMEKQLQEIKRVRENKKDLRSDESRMLRTLIELKSNKAQEGERVRRRLEETQAMQQEAARKSESMMDKYYQAFAKLQDLTQIDNVDQLVNLFVTVEDENFATFNYIQRINRDIERHEEEYNERLNEMRAYSATAGSDDTAKQRQAQDMDVKLHWTNKQSEVLEELKERRAAQLDELSNVVDSTFHKAECDQMSGLKDQWSRPEEKKLSASAVPKTSEITLLQDDRHPMVMPEMSLQTMMQGVDPMTIVQYLGIIEQRASEIVQAFQQWQQMSSSNQGHGLPRLQSPEVNATLPAPIYDKMQVTASSLSRVPPMPSALFASMLDDDDEDDEGSRTMPVPLSRERLRDVTISSLRRELEASAARGKADAKYGRQAKSAAAKSGSTKMPRIARGGVMSNSGPVGFSGNGASSSGDRGGMRYSATTDSLPHPRRSRGTR